MLRKDDMTKTFLLSMYELLLKPRLIEEKMLLLLRQGKLAKWFSGIGQEAIAVGASLAMQPDEYLLPMHRNLGVFTTRNVPLERLLYQFQGSDKGFTKGRDRSFHFGSQEHKLVGMISHLGPQLAVGAGIALAEKRSGQQRATLVFTGEGATSQGDFHEALNLAAVWDLPLIILIENNGYALSTPVQEQYRCESLASRGIGYGMASACIDGNDVLSVYDNVKRAREYCIKQQKPFLLECFTFRMRGHEEASGTDYVPAELLESWAQKDPLARYRAFLSGEQPSYAREPLSSAEELDALENRLRKELNKTINGVFNGQSGQNEQASPKTAGTEKGEDTELAGMYAPPAPPIPPPPSSKKSDKRFIDAISDAMRQALGRYQQLMIMGQDIAGYGGVFKVTKGFAETFGKDRIRNTPLCESAVIGAAFGASIAGYPSIVEMQFADFISMGFNQVVNNLAKSHYRWGHPASLVIRMPTGAGTGAGPFHSQSNEAWFTKVPGLKILYPASPEDAKGLLAAAVEDPNPVLFFEHKLLYRSIRGEVPDDYFTLPIGKARLWREGKALSIITYGLGLHWALELLNEQPGVSADLLDLRSLQPWDQEAVAASVKKTGRALILHEDTLSNGFGAEIAAWLGEHCFSCLDAPVMRCCSLDTAVPVNTTLEQQFLAKARLRESLKHLLSY